MEIEFAEIVQDSPDEPLHINIFAGGILWSFLVEDVLAKMNAVEQSFAPDAAKWSGHYETCPANQGGTCTCGY